MPRWFKKLGVQQMLFQVWSLSYYVTQSTGQLESWSNETTPLGFILKSGESFQYPNEQIITTALHLHRWKIYTCLLLPFCRLPLQDHTHQMRRLK
jgi:hypothetical protein